MTAIQVREISSEVYMEHNKTIVNGLISVKPTMSTKEVCKFLKCSRQWLGLNRNIFGDGNMIVSNKRGDMIFKSEAVVKYARKKMIQ